jgi:hypothetical protein
VLALIVLTDGIAELIGVDAVVFGIEASTEGDVIAGTSAGVAGMVEVALVISGVAGTTGVELTGGVQVEVAG